MFSAIYHVLWILLHTIFSIYNYIYIIITGAVFRAGGFVNSFMQPSAPNELQYIDRCKSDWKKIPRHLSIVLGTQQVSSEILSKVAVYALITGIDYISYYDARDEFTLDRVEIPKYIETRKVSNGRFLWSMSSNNSRRKSTGQLRYKNGLDKSIEVVVVSSQDGRPLLANVTRDLWKRRNDPAVKDTIANKDRLAASITSNLGKCLGNLPEPDLAIILDETMSTYGVLPWHTRFTEFHCIKNINCFDVNSFVNVLYKFSKCEQRFGK